MSEVKTVSPVYNLGNAMPVTSTAVNSTPVNQTAGVTSAVTSPIYNYPTASLYSPNAQTAGTQANGKQQMSGVNIYIYNPSAIGNQPPVVMSTPQNNEPVASQPIAQQSVVKYDTAPAPVEKKEEEKKKPVVELTDEYIKTLENYLKSDDASLRNMGVKELVKRFEEDNTRTDNKPLTALLNIALQDPNADNRMLAMSVIAGGNAHGDDNTIKLLQNLQASGKLFGMESKMANDALLNSVAEKKFI